MHTGYHCIKRGMFFFLLLFGTLFFIGAENSVIEGYENWRIILHPTRGSFTDVDVLRDYENNSNRQIIVEATPERIIIERYIDYSPLHSVFLLSESAVYGEDPELAEYLRMPESEYVLGIADTIAESLPETGATQIDYVNGVLYYIRDNVVWRRGNGIEAEEVLRRGYTVCSGFANAAAALLRTRGIPARVAFVQTIKHPTWNAGGHAELEVYYHEIGWVSYDPQRHHHHAPFPRVYLGNGPGGRIYSSNTELWRATRFFDNNGYRVTYENLGREIKMTGMTGKPEKHDFISRNDGTGDYVPSVTGIVYDGYGNISKETNIYYSLEKNPKKYAGISLMDGSYMIKNDTDGGRLYLNKNGFVIFYNFDGSEVEKYIRHDVRFDETDSIVIDTGKPNSTVRWYYTLSRYYTFKADQDGIIRLHLNLGMGNHRINNTIYEYIDGKWAAAE